MKEPIYFLDQSIQKFIFSKVENVYGFVKETNRIEGINRDPTCAEIDEMIRFMCIGKMTVKELKRFVSVYQPDAVIRNKTGLNVRVGNHLPPKGGLHIEKSLKDLLSRATRNNAYQIHIEYETLHPFTDGNGRSGRALWAWQMQQFPLGFLHHFYYQTLSETKTVSPERDWGYPVPPKKGRGK